MPFNEAIAAAVDSTADNSGNINHYLATIARGQHNLGDMRRELTDEQQMQSMIAVLSAGRVDPMIKDTAIDGLAMPTKLWLAEKSMQLSPTSTSGRGLRFWKAKTSEAVQESPVTIDDPNIERRKQPLDAADIKARTIRDDDTEDAPAEATWQQRRPPRSNGGGEDHHGVRPPKSSWVARRESLAGAGMEKY
jgi:hypothetical protein